ncbi:hypothetical protein K458DRAFT_432623 [Lentithecium fluviatile CBS 122367]|uniref:Uncharacterized protein n=1 Tax=Lentithecium fluviatile CBS 122367 TaxID=1168545 RepID=A0A6G1IX01_9PLEO|nr:hypothetical protein K458DRAFT_432623 [Lentithecium fluviatile CBS 122367]
MDTYFRNRTQQNPRMEREVRLPEQALHRRYGTRRDPWASEMSWMKFFEAFMWNALLVVAFIVLYYLPDFFLAADPSTSGPSHDSKIPHFLLPFPSAPTPSPPIPLPSPSSSLYGPP